MTVVSRVYKPPATTTTFSLSKSPYEKLAVGFYCSRPGRERSLEQRDFARQLALRPAVKREIYAHDRVAVITMFEVYRLPGR